MRYPPLIESCRIAIENEWCTGCQALEEPTFRGRWNCIYSKPPRTEISIRQVKINLGGINGKK